MDRKVLRFTGLILFFIALLFWNFRKVETNVYIGSTGCTGDEGVDFQLHVNDNLVLEDTIYYHPYGYLNVKAPFLVGWNQIRVASKKSRVVLEQRIFIFFGKHIVIEYMPPFTDVRDDPEFCIWGRYGNFYYE